MGRSPGDGRVTTHCDTLPDICCVEVSCLVNDLSLHGRSNKPFPASASTSGFECAPGIQSNHKHRDGLPSTRDTNTKTAQNICVLCIVSRALHALDGWRASLDPQRPSDAQLGGDITFT